MGDDALWRELIRDHQHHPHGRGLDGATGEAVSFQHNPVCGDEVTVHLAVVDQSVTRMRWVGAGCAISQASASMLAALIETEAATGGGLSRARALELVGRFRASFRAPLAEPLSEEAFGDAVALTGVARFPSRVTCAMLAWAGVEDALGR